MIERPFRPALRRGLAALTALTLAAAACSDDEPAGTSAGESGGESGETTGGRLVVAQASPVRKLDFVGILDTSAFTVFQTNVLEGLTRAVLDEDGDLTWEPALAESWDREGPSQWRFHLREDVSFHDGRPFTSADVVFTVGRITAEDAEVGILLGNIERAEAVDEHTVDIFTKQPTEFLDRAVSGLTVIPDGWGEDAAAAASQLPGTGPYRLVEYGNGEDVLLELNPDYWGDNEGAFEEVQIRTIPEAGSRLAALEAGEVDVALQLSPELAGAAPKVLTTAGAEVEFFRLTNKGVLADKRVRQALNMAVDREVLIESIRSGYATLPNAQQIPPQTFGYNTDLEDYPFDPEGAEELLEEAGALGKPLSMVCSADSYGAVGQDSCSTVAQMVRDVGLDVKLDILPKDAYIEQFFAKQNGLPQPDLVYIISGTDTLTADTPMRVWYDCENGRNAFCDPEVEAKVMEATTLGLEEQEEAWKDLMAELHDQAPMLWLTVPEVVVGVARDVEGPIFPLTGANGDADWSKWRRVAS
ncbi:MAG: ABC transporter substrate-binding protein [Acidimicrobiia bacterium]